jgi:hypothetical protein
MQFANKSVVSPNAGGTRPAYEYPTTLWQHPPVTVLFNTRVPPTALDSSDWFADSPLTNNDPYLGRLLRRPGRLGARAPVRMASIEAGHGILRVHHAARQRTHGERKGGQTV